MIVNCIYGHGYDSNIYVVTGDKPSIVDCGTGLHKKQVIEEIKKVIDPSKIKQIILTHEHFDHVGGVKQIHDLTDNKAIIMAHVNATDKIERGESAFASMLGGKMPKIAVNKKLKNNDEITIGSEKFKVFHTPGHTPGSICLYSNKSKTLFSGDTIFSHGSFGRYDLPGGNLSHLEKSIEKMNKLDIKNLYPGHEAIVEGNANEHVTLSFKNVKSFY